MKGNTNDAFTYPDEEIVTEIEQTVENLSHMLSFTKQYYQHIHHDEIDLLVNMIERVKKSMDGECYINEQDFIKIHALIENYDNANNSFSDQRLGAYYLQILAGDAKYCLGFLKKAIKNNFDINEDIIDFFVQLCLCLKIMASYEAFHQNDQTIPLQCYTIQG